jgi:hypothetical protein
MKRASRCFKYTDKCCHFIVFEGKLILRRSTCFKINHQQKIHTNINTHIHTQNLNYKSEVVSLCLHNGTGRQHFLFYLCFSRPFIKGSKVPQGILRGYGLTSTRLSWHNERLIPLLPGNNNQMTNQNCKVTLHQSWTSYKLRDSFSYISSHVNLHKQYTNFTTIQPYQSHNMHISFLHALL